jgi:ribosome-binding protein aMBF1 (putative translation factor)
MATKKDSFRPGDKVPETGHYLCEICNTEGGVDAHVLKAGAKFPSCMNCGCSTSWRKAAKSKGK